MSWEKWRCNHCGHEFYPRKPEEELTKPHQCSKCGSYDVYNLTEEQEYAKEVWEMRKEGRISALLDTVEVVLKRRGFIFRPLKTWTQVKRIVRMVEEMEEISRGKKKGGQAIG